MTENIVIGKDSKSILTTLFFNFNEPYDKTQIHFSKAKDMQELMIEIGAYKSRGESFRANRAGPIPKGWTEMWANKKQKIWIWNPITKK